MDTDQGKVINIGVSSQPIDQLNNHALVFFLFEDSLLTGKIPVMIDRILDGIIMRSVKVGRIKGKYGETTLVASEGRIQSPKILFIGLGETSLHTPKRIKESATILLETLTKINIFNFATFLPDIMAPDYDYAKTIEGFIEGLIEGLISIDFTSEEVLYVTIVDEQRRLKDTITVLNRGTFAHHDRVRVLFTQNDLGQETITLS
ncbi:MAG: M17 family peptidase N-terminal domain-containing protein [Thermodesulfobacteriota bacterium]|nr:M17 family peptidase N-terminal domain-containing protein [Thermodesulfobacteriota bacterium]